MTTDTAKHRPPSRDLPGIGVTWVAFFAGANILGANRASMISLSEPGLAAPFAWFVFGEYYRPAQWCGLVLVLASIILFEKQAQQAT